MYPLFSTNTINSCKHAPSTIASNATEGDRSFIFSTQQTTKRGVIGSTNESINLGNMLRRPQSSYNSNRPGTAATSTRRPTTAGTSVRPPKRIMAIAEGRGVAPEVGICIFDINSCEIELSQVNCKPLPVIDLIITLCEGV